MPASQVIDVAIAILRRGSAVLVCRRPAKVHLAGFWEFPGGKCRNGESPQSCLLRELREELGVRVRVLRRLPPVEHPYPERAIRLHPFVCEIVAGEPAAHSADECRWVEQTDLQAYQFPPANEQLLRLLKTCQAL